MLACGMNAKVTDLTLSTKDWSVPLEHKQGYLYLGTPSHETLHNESDAREILFSKRELSELHKKSGYAATDKIYKLLSKAGENITEQDLDFPEKVTGECIACQKLAKRPMRYTATVPGKYYVQPRSGI